MEDKKILRNQIDNCTSSAKKFRELHTHLIGPIKQSSEIYIEFFLDYTLKTLISTHACSTMKFYTLLLLLKASELKNYSFFYFLARSSDLVEDIYRYAQFESNPELPISNQGMHFFSKFPSQKDAIIGVNFVRLSQELLIYWNESSIALKPRKSFDILHYIFQHLKKKIKLPKTYDFISKEFDFTQEIAICNYRIEQPYIAITIPDDKKEKVYTNAEIKAFNFNHAWNDSPTSFAEDSDVVNDNEPFKIALQKIEEQEETTKGQIDCSSTTDHVVIVNDNLENCIEQDAGDDTEHNIEIQESEGQGSNITAQSSPLKTPQSAPEEETSSQHNDFLIRKISIKSDAEELPKTQIFSHTNSIHFSTPHHTRTKSDEKNLRTKGKKAKNLTSDLMEIQNSIVKSLNNSKYSSPKSSIFIKTPDNGTPNGGSTRPLGSTTEAPLSKFGARSLCNSALLSKYLKKGSDTEVGSSINQQGLDENVINGENIFDGQNPKPVIPSLQRVNNHTKSKSGSINEQLSSLFEEFKPRKRRNTLAGANALTSPSLKLDIKVDEPMSCQINTDRSSVKPEMQADSSMLSGAKAFGSRFYENPEIYCTSTSNQRGKNNLGELAQMSTRLQKLKMYTPSELMFEGNLGGRPIVPRKKSFKETKGAQENEVFGTDEENKLLKEKLKEYEQKIKLLEKSLKYNKNGQRLTSVNCDISDEIIESKLGV